MHRTSQFGPLGARDRRSSATRRGGLGLEILEQRRLLTIDVSGLSPSDDATAVAVGDNLVLTFGEDVRPGPGSGNILIKNASDDSLIEAVNVHSDRVTFNGATVTVDPVADLPADSFIYVEVDPAAIRNMANAVANAVIFDEDFERLRMLDSPLATDGVFNPLADANQYALAFTGTMVVTEAGEYTFGGNSDDGMWLLLDLNRDGDLTDIGDEVIVDQTTHGNQDRLSTCGIESNVVSCVGSGTESYNLAAGEYLFQYGYFEQGGGSSGEFFYAKGTLETFDANAFVLMGNPSQGISVTEDGITATTYKAIDGDTVTYFYARDLVDGFIDPADGFPASAVVPTADVWNTGGTGRFQDNNPVPGVPLVDPGEGTDWSPEPPFGWTNELPAPTPAGGRPEYNGWIAMDKNFWITQQGDQGRTLWGSGDGTVALVDPDAFDDFVDIDPEGGLLNALFTTPAIDLTGVAANSVVLNFDSSFRSEPTQVAVLEVSFNGGASWSELLRYEGNAAEDLDHIDENLNFELSNPAGGSMHVRWSMLQGSNDWWWAIDNIVITADVVGETYAGIADNESWNFNTFSSPKVQFTETAIVVNENVGEVMLTVMRIGDDASGPLTVDYATSNGSASAGQDYTAANGTISFAPGETEKTVIVPVINDDTEERAENFTITLSNASGGYEPGGPATVTIAASDGTTIVFQEGAEVTVNGTGTGVTYAGTSDADPRGASPDETRDRNEVNVDGDDGGAQVHGLMKFADLFGDGAAQIPEGVEIARATLTLNVTNEGDLIRVHRLLGEFDEETVTWNTLTLNGNTTPGLQDDGVEATAVLRTFAAPTPAVVVVDVTADIQAWLGGETNFGWGFTPTGTNGVDWDSAEGANVSTRPKLTVEFVDVEDVQLEGDVNGDGSVNLTDFNILKSNFGQPGSREQGDLNGDGTVGLPDFNILKANFGAGGSAGTPAAVDVALAAAADDDADDEEGLTPIQDGVGVQLDNLH